MEDYSLFLLVVGIIVCGSLFLRHLKTRRAAILHNTPIPQTTPTTSKPVLIKPTLDHLSPRQDILHQLFPYHLVEGRTISISSNEIIFTNGKVNMESINAVLDCCAIAKVYLLHTISEKEDASLQQKEMLHLLTQAGLIGEHGIAVHVRKYWYLIKNKDSSMKPFYLHLV